MWIEYSRLYSLKRYVNSRTSLYKRTWEYLVIKSFPHVYWLSLILTQHCIFCGAAEYWYDMNTMSQKNPHMCTSHFKHPQALCCSVENAEKYSWSLADNSCATSVFAHTYVLTQTYRNAWWERWQYRYRWRKYSIFSIHSVFNDVEYF